MQSRFDIGGFPTLFLYKKGHYYKYNGDRTLESLQEFIKKDHVPTNENVIPPSKNWFQKALSFIWKIIDTYVYMLDKYGMSGVSRSIKVGMVITFLLLPFILLPICICIMINQPARPKKVTKETTKESPQEKPKTE